MPLTRSNIREKRSAAANNRRGENESQMSGAGKRQAPDLFPPRDSEPPASAIDRPCGAERKSGATHKGLHARSSCLFFPFLHLQTQQSSSRAMSSTPDSHSDNGKNTRLHKEQAEYQHGQHSDTYDNEAAVDPEVLRKLMYACGRDIRPCGHALTCCMFLLSTAARLTSAS